MRPNGAWGAAPPCTNAVGCDLVAWWFADDTQHAVSGQPRSSMPSPSISPRERFEDVHKAPSKRAIRLAQLAHS